MIIDKELELSDAQALTATAVSTNVIDLGVDRDMGKGEPVPITVEVQTILDSAGDAATLVVTLETDDNEAFASAATVWTSGTIAEATLVAGYKFAINYLPRENERYLRLVYTVAVEDFTSGNIDAYIGTVEQSNGANVT